MQRANCTACGGRCRGIDQIDHGFSLCQIKLAVEVGPARKFSRFSQTRAEIQTSCEQHLQDDGAAMTLQLKDIFAGKRVGSWKMKNYSAVDNAPVRRKKVGKGGDSRQRLLTAYCLREFPKVLSGNPNNSDPATAGSRGDRGNGVRQTCRNLGRGRFRAWRR